MSKQYTVYLKLIVIKKCPSSTPYSPFPCFIFLYCIITFEHYLIYLLSPSPKMNVNSMRAENFACFIDISLKSR